MRLTCLSADLSEGLSSVALALPKKTNKEMLNNILFESCEEGLRLTATDEMLSIESTIPAAIAEEGRTLLPGKLICDIVRKLPGGDVDLRINDRQQTTIRCAPTRASLVGMDAVNFPELPQVEGEHFSMKQSLLREMIQHTLFACAIDESRPILTGCLFEITRTDIRLVALDGFRLAMRYEQVEGPENPVNAVIGSNVLSELRSLLDDSDDPVELTFSRMHLKMRVGQTCVIARLLEGEYIRYRQILPTSYQTQVTLTRADFVQAAERASIIAAFGSSMAMFRFEGDRLTVSANSDNCEVETTIDVSCVGKDITIAFNLKYISDVLRAISTDTVCMRFNSSVSPCIICPEEGESYLYLVLPVRLFGS